MHLSPRGFLSAKSSRARVSIEALEQRIAPATFTVTTTADSGAGSLRQAILDANATTAPDLIDFAIYDDSSIFVITPLSALPQIVAPLTIDGYTQYGTSENTADQGTNAELAIVLDGSFAGSANGLSLIGPGSAGSKITGLSIINFSGAGIYLESDNNTVVGNFIGIEPDGVTVQGNGGHGVWVSGGKGEIIGTTAVADRNLIGGNGSSSTSAGGVEITSGSASISGNLIGTDAVGTNALGNAHYGVSLVTANGTTIADNVISGNSGPGIQLSGTAGAKIQDNLIGLDATGLSPLGNTADGIALTAGTTSTEISGNTIGDNRGDGVSITGAGTNSNYVIANQIGVNVRGEAWANGLNGVLVTGGAAFNRIGGAEGDGNLIANHDGVTESGIDSAGVLVSGSSTSSTAISANTIANNTLGIWIDDATNNLIGATATNPGNVIIGNSTAGIYVSRPHATNNTIAGNLIGLEDFGDGGLVANPNGVGIHIFNAANNTIGGITAVEGNYIAGNTGDGILIDRQDQYFGLGEFDSFAAPAITQTDFVAAQTGEGAPFTTLFTSGQTITLNFDGPFEAGSSSLYFKLWGLNTKLAGQQVASLTFDGVAQDATQFDTSQVGPATEQYTFFNVDPALLTDGHLSVSLKLGTLPSGQKVGIDYAELDIHKDSYNTITANTVGGDDDSDLSLNNGGAGIHLVSTEGVTIGDGTSEGANVISGNTGAGIHLQYASDTRVRGNLIGSLSAARGKATNNDGVLIENGFSNHLGGGATGDRNVISGNTRDGVRMFLSSGNNDLTNNAIGTDFDGLVAKPNGGNGVSILSGSYFNFVGIAGGVGNVISGNRGHGVLVSDTDTNGNQIFANRIGTDATGTARLANGGSGIRLADGATDTHVGDGARSEGNTISANTGDGITIFAADKNIIDGNYLGTTGDGLEALGNGGAGVFIVGASNVVQNNVISGNTLAGVHLSAGVPTSFLTGGAPAPTAIGPLIIAQFNVIRSNLIGVDEIADPANPLPNADGVIFTDGASDNLVGGTTAIDGNHIAYNEGSVIGFFGAGPGVSIIPASGQGDGVRVENGGVRNAILGNSIHDNAGYGIHLDGGNNDQTSPTLNAALIKYGTMIFKGEFTSTPNTTFRIEMFTADGIDPLLPDSEGETYLGSFDVTTDASGFVSYRKTLLTAVPAGTLITGTATALDSLGTATDTSQFAGAIKAIPTIAIAEAATVEGPAGDKQLNFLVTLGANPEGGKASVAYATADFSSDARTATADVDYASVTGATLNINVSDPLTDSLTRQLSVTIHGDTAPESRERFKVLLSNAVGVGFDDGEDQAVGTIIDDDQHSFVVGASTGSKVEVFNSVTGSLVREFNAFEASYRSGVRVASGDVTGDGINDIIVGTGSGGGARVRVFDGTDTSANPSPIASFQPFPKSYRGALSVAAGDVNGDGRADLIVSAGTGSLSQVRVLDLSATVDFGGSPSLLAKFTPSPKTKGGVRVASGDFDGDGLGDIITTTGASSEARIYHGDGTAFTGALGKFSPFSKAVRGGLFATAGDLDRDGRDDLIFGAAAGASEVRTFLTHPFAASAVRSFTPFAGTSGVRLAITDVNSDGIADIVAGQGLRGVGTVRVLNGSNNAELLKITSAPKGEIFLG